MSKVAVVYWSGTGNTRTMAEIIAGVIGADLFTAAEFNGGMGRSSRSQGPVQGNDLRYELRITFDEAAKGCEKSFEIFRNERISIITVNPILNSDA